MSAMQVETLDLLTKRGRFDPEAARAIGEAIYLETRRSQDSLATKQDLHTSQTSLREEFATFRSEIKEAMAALRAELKGDMAALRAELKEDMAALRAEVKLDIAALRTEIYAFKAEIVRWVFLAIMGQSAMLLGGMYFLLQHTSR